MGVESKKNHNGENAENPCRSILRQRDCFTGMHARHSTGGAALAFISSTASSKRNRMRILPIRTPKLQDS